VDVAPADQLIVDGFSFLLPCRESVDRIAAAYLFLDVVELLESRQR
jgi:hypothetical protein